MSRLNQSLAVAAWEFRRFFRVRDQVIALVMAIGAGVGSHFLTKAVEGSKTDIRIAVTRAENFPALASFDPKTVLGEKTKLKLESREESEEAELRRQIERRELDGLAVVRGTRDIELVVFKRPPWEDQFRLLVMAARTQAALGNDPLAALTLALPGEVTLSFIEQDGRAGRPQMAVAGIVGGLTMFAVFLSLIYLLVGITGEKQVRVTEQVVAAISPQAWIDGKVLGLTAVAVATALTYGAAIALFFFGLHLSGNASMAKIGLAADPGQLALFLVVATLGLFFWNFLFAAFAATIDDPNTSARSSLLIIAMLPVGIAFAGMDQPDSAVMRTLALVPGTSITVLPVRVVLGSVAAWEVLASLALLTLSTLALRRLAGKIFAAGIMMVGKEPSIREMWQALRRA